MTLEDLRHTWREAEEARATAEIRSKRISHEYDKIEATYLRDGMSQPKTNGVMLLDHEIISDARHNAKLQLIETTSKETILKGAYFIAKNDQEKGLRLDGQITSLVKEMAFKN